MLRDGRAALYLLPVPLANATRTRTSSSPCSASHHSSTLRHLSRLTIPLIVVYPEVEIFKNVARSLHENIVEH